MSGRSESIRVRLRRRGRVLRGHPDASRQRGDGTNCERQGHFAPPRLESLEEVLEYGVGLRRGRVFADLWDVARFFSCANCGPSRPARLHSMNLTQRPAPPILCSCEGRR